MFDAMQPSQLKALCDCDAETGRKLLRRGGRPRQAIVRRRGEDEKIKKSRLRGIRQWDSFYIAMLVAGFMRVGRQDNLRSRTDDSVERRRQTKAVQRKVGWMRLSQFFPWYFFPSCLIGAYRSPRCELLAEIQLAQEPAIEHQTAPLRVISGEYSDCSL